jgi:serine protease Do
MGRAATCGSKEKSMSAEASSEAVPASKPRTRVIVVSAAALALAGFAGAVGGFVWGGGGPPAVADSAPVSALPVAAPAPMMLGASGYMPSLADIVERVSPAVVSLKAKVTGGGSSAEDDPSEEDLERLPPSLREFFERYRRGGPNQRNRPRGEVQGSGFVVDSTGYIVTNNHVVANATEIEITFSDSKKYKARIIGRDEPTDLALLKIDGNNKFPAVTFGDDSRVRVGDWVLAVGNPFGLGGTVTAGIVSARGRDDVGGTTYTDYLQIDAAINRGNSGGPTFDMSGRVIGVNTAIYSPSGTSAGIGFAIPSNTVRRIVDELRKSGSVTRGWLGVQIQSLSEDAAQALGLPNANGAIVAEVIEGSPAQKAGFKQGDVVLKMNGTVVKDNRDLTRRVGALQAGETASFVVWRDNREMTISVTIAKRPGEQQLSSRDPRLGGGGSDAKPGRAQVSALGLGLTAITPIVRQEFGLDGNEKGVLITDVDPDSDAAERGLRPGDRIVAVAGTEVRSVTDVSAAVSQAKSQKRPSVLLFVERGENQRVFVPVKIK